MVYLIDASVYVFRAWYSMPAELRDAEGNPTHAVYGFAWFLCDLIERRQPRFLQWLSMRATVVDIAMRCSRPTKPIASPRPLN